MSSTPSSRLISSVSSFDYLSASSHSRQGSGESSDSSYVSVSDEISSDDDEILLSFSETGSPVRLSSPSSASPVRSQGAQSPNTFSDDDYVVFGGVKTPAENQYESFAAGGNAVANVESLTQTLAQMEIRQGRPRKARSRRFPRQQQSSPDAFEDDDAVSVRLVSQAPSPHRRARKPRRPAAAPVAAATSSDSESSSSDNGTHVKSPSTPKPKKGKKKKAAASPKSSPSKTTSAKTTAATPGSPKGKRPGLGERPIVDDISEAGDDKATPLGYEEAVQYVTS